MLEPAIIFTPDLLGRATRAPQHDVPAIVHWAREPGPRGDILREQIERAARCVPESHRARVLGPLRSKSATDEQVRAALGGLLLAKTLRDHDWSVDFEPAVAGKTPDLLIAKGGHSFYVEVRRIPDRRDRKEERALARLSDVLSDVQTHTPLQVHRIQIDGRASLAPVVAYVREVLERKPFQSDGYTFHEDGVYLSFSLAGPFDFSTSAVAFGPDHVHFGDQAAEVRAAIDEKLMEYKHPIVVALDFFDCLGDPFRVAEEAILGRDVYCVPIDTRNGGCSGEPHWGRAADGILTRANRDGARTRTRLQALLPFFLLDAAPGGFEVHARILCNPALEHLPVLDGFAPIPSLVVTQSYDDKRVLNYNPDKFSLDEDGEAQPWVHVP